MNACYKLTVAVDWLSVLTQLVATTALVFLVMMEMDSTAQVNCHTRLDLKAKYFALNSRLYAAPLWTIDCTAITYKTALV